MTITCPARCEIVAEVLTLPPPIILRLVRCLIAIPDLGDLGLTVFLEIQLLNDHGSFFILFKITIDTLRDSISNMLMQRN